MSQSAKPDSNYRLVFFDVPEAPEKVRDLICRVTGLHPSDAMHWIANAPGIVKYPLAEEQTRALLDGLYELGVAAEAWRVDRIPNLYPPRNVRELAVLEGGFQIKGIRKEPMHWVPWEKVELIAAGRVEQEDEVREVTPPGWARAAAMGLNAVLRRPQAVARRERSIRLPREPVGEAIVVRRDPLIAFRLVETHLNYGYLGARLKPSAAENFPTLLEDFRRGATNAYLPHSTVALLDGGDPGDYVFPTSQDLLDYATHRLLWCWYRRDRDSGQSHETQSDA